MVQGPTREAVAGRHAVLAALRSPREVHSVLVSRDAGGVGEVVDAARGRGLSVRFVGAHELATLVGTARHQGVGAMVGPLPPQSVKGLLELARQAGEAPFLLAVDGIEDPQNLGAIARSAFLAGAHGLIVPERGTASLGPGAAKASSGALSHLAVAPVSSLAPALASLRREGVLVVGADANGGKAPWRLGLAGPVCLVVGSERAGLSRQVLEALDERVCIPTPGGDLSLNASAAAAVLLFERVRQASR